MIITFYEVDKEEYNAAAHNASMTTTEYKYKNEILVCMKIDTNLSIRLNNALQHEFNKDIKDVQYFHKKAYTRGDAKKTTRTTFEEKIKRFDMGKTVVEQEIVEDYSYIDKKDSHTSVQIAVTVKNDTDMAATIDFKDVEQYDNFTCPAWLAEKR